MLNIVWCMAYKMGVRARVVYCAIVMQSYCNGVDNAGGGRHRKGGGERISSNGQGVVAVLAVCAVGRVCCRFGGGGCPGGQAYFLII